jgi:hypothetical protein
VHREWRIARQIVLNARNEIAARGKRGRKERVFVAAHGVAMQHDGDRQHVEARGALRLLVATHIEIDRNAALACGVEQRQALVADSKLCGRKKTGKHGSNRTQRDDPFPPSHFPLSHGLSSRERHGARLSLAITHRSQTSSSRANDYRRLKCPVGRINFR